jgi:hypothetical protein
MSKREEEEEGEEEEEEEEENRIASTQQEEVENQFRQFNPPFRLLVTGASQSGKTRWIHRFLKDLHRMTGQKKDYFSRVIYFHALYQDNMHDMMKDSEVDIDFVSTGFEAYIAELTREVSARQGTGSDQPLLLIFEDLQTSAGESRMMADIFTRASSHLQWSVIISLQNTFGLGKAHGRTIRYERRDN